MLADLGEARGRLEEVTGARTSDDVLRGDSGRTLAFGPAWNEGSAAPGHGTAIISGHRDTHFAFLHQLQQDSGGERFGEGRQVIDCVFSGGALRADVGQAVRFYPDHILALRDNGRYRGDV